jgi:hypothetical protein
MFRAGALLLVVASFAALGIPAAADQAHTYVIEVSQLGFNPAVCRLSRGDTVFWKNVGSGPVRVTWENPGGGPPLFDSGEFGPGETSPIGYSGFQFPNRWVFTETHSGHTGVVITPTFSNSQDPDCSPDPAARPPQGHPAFDCAVDICLHAALIGTDG